MICDLVQVPSLITKHVQSRVMLASCLAGDGAACSWLCDLSTPGPDLAGAVQAARLSGTSGCSPSGAKRLARASSGTGPISLPYVLVPGI